MRPETPTSEEARELLNDIIADTDGKLFERQVIAKLLNAGRGPVKINAKPYPYAKSLPKYVHEGDAGMDLFSAAETYLEPGETDLISTGVRLEIPEGYAGFVIPRSGLALKGLTVLNAPGLIDSSYRGDIGVILANLGKEPYRVFKGDRIAQLLILPVPHIELSEVSDLSETDRGTGGFGSTGK